jgi:hypothetical protein
MKFTLEEPDSRVVCYESQSGTSSSGNLYCVTANWVALAFVHRTRVAHVVGTLHNPVNGCPARRRDHSQSMILVIAILYEQVDDFSPFTYSISSDNVAEGPVRLLYCGIIV